MVENHLNNLEAPKGAERSFERLPESPKEAKAEKEGIRIVVEQPPITGPVLPEVKKRREETAAVGSVSKAIVHLARINLIDLFERRVPEVPNSTLLNFFREEVSKEKAA